MFFLCFTNDEKFYMYLKKYTFASEICMSLLLNFV